MLDIQRLNPPSFGGIFKGFIGMKISGWQMLTVEVQGLLIIVYLQFRYGLAEDMKMIQ